MTREMARPSWVRNHPRAPWAAVGAVCLGAFMGQLDASIVTLAFPQMSHDFGTPLASVQWVSLSYLAVLAVLLIPVGRWSDVHGRKLLYVNGFVVFTLASAACGLAPGLGWLVGARVVQAVGAALLQANSVALVVGSVAPTQARAALGVQAAAQALGLALGPVVGGVLVGLFGWRSVFLVNLPVGVLAVAAGLLLLPRTRTRSGPGRADRLGNVLLAVTVLATLASLTLLAGSTIRPPVVVGTAALAVLAGWAFWRVELRAGSPLVPPERLRTGGVGVGLLRGLLGYLVLFAPLVLYPFEFTRWGLRPGPGGLVLTCLPAGFALAALLGGRAAHRLGNLTRVRVGGGLAALSALAQVLAWGSPVAVALLLALTGFSLGIVLPANNAMVMTAVPASASAVTGGMINVARTGGTSLGIALTAVGVQVAAGRGWPPAPIVLAGLAVAAVGIAVAGRAGGPTVPDDEMAV